MFVLEFIIDLLTFPFRRFPKTTIAILVILAGTGYAGASLLHTTAANLVNDGCTLLSGHTHCLRLPSTKK